MLTFRGAGAHAVSSSSSPLPLPLEDHEAQARPALIPTTTTLARQKMFTGLFPTLRGYSPREQLLPDVVAGLTVGSLAIPQSMSYAMIAGLPVQNGLYSDLQVAYPVLGRSRHLVVGPVAIMSLLTTETLRPTGAEPLSQKWVVLSALLALIVGVYQLVFAVTRLGGWIERALSENTVKGFTTVAALTIASTQVSNLLGYKCQFESCSVFTVIFEGIFVRPNSKTLILSFASLLILEVLRCAFKTSMLSKLGSLIVMACGISFQYYYEAEHIETVGFIPSGLPVSTPMSDFTSLVEWRELARLTIFGFPIALLGFTEAFAIAKTRPADDLDADRELGALGLANMWTCLLGGYCCTGSFSRSAVNAEAGSTSGVSVIVAALLVVLVLMTFTGPLSLLPKACVAAVVVSAILKLIDFEHVRRLVRIRDYRHLTAYITIFLVGIVVGVEFGLLVGFAIDSTSRVCGKRKDSDSTVEPEELEPSPGVFDRDGANTENTDIEDITSPPRNGRQSGKVVPA